MSGIDVFASGYLGRIFYFCLKKTGNEQDAAELAGEISLEVVQTLSKGKEPERFDSWLWAVARNRWARWAAKKYTGPLNKSTFRSTSSFCPQSNALRRTLSIPRN